ncbi:MAG TPA: hypothetical protein VEG60_21380 [Candidatus Binatia bacterium]|nr:hypothetical protein [Candidatus Binatia bacterium]
MHLSRLFSFVAKSRSASWVFGRPSERPWAEPCIGVVANPKDSITTPTLYGLNKLFAGGYDLETAPPEVSANRTITVNPPTGSRKLNSRPAMFYHPTGITSAMIMLLTGFGSQ